LFKIFHHSTFAGLYKLIVPERAWVTPRCSS
jgi:hypothetical protein